jgi:hypothetical protein
MEVEDGRSRDRGRVRDQGPERDRHAADDPDAGRLQAGDQLILIASDARTGQR